MIGDSINTNLMSQPVDSGINDYIKMGTESGQSAYEASNSAGYTPGTVADLSYKQASDNAVAEASDNSPGMGKIFGLISDGLKTIGGKLGQGGVAPRIQPLAPIQMGAPVANVNPMQAPNFTPVPQFVSTSDILSKWNINNANNEMNDLLNNVYKNITIKKRVK